MINHATATVKNTVVATGAQLVTLASQFTMQIVFVQTMSANYLGANGLFNNLMNILSFAELGIGAAMTFSLYRPLANRDMGLVDALLTCYRRLYGGIGFTILLLGLLLAAGLPFFVKPGLTIPHIQFMFYLYVIGTALSYFFSYARSLFIADQRAYVNNINQVGCRFIQNIVQIVVLVVWQNYVAFLMLHIGGTLLANLLINWRAKQQYPMLTWRSSQRIPETIKQKLRENVLGNISAKVGVIVVNGTDNLLIAKYLGLSVLGAYTNYALIVQGLSSLVGQVMAAIVGVFGHIGVTESVAQQQVAYYRNLCLIALVSTVLAGGCFTVMQDFIRLVLGPAYVLADFTVLLIVINLGFTMLRQANLSFAAALGLFWTMRYKSLVEAGVNLGTSLWLITQTDLGINAVLLGNNISNLVVNFWWEPWLVFKHGFQQSAKCPLVKFTAYHVALAGLVGVHYVCHGWLPQMGWLGLIFTGMGSVVGYSIVFILAFSCQIETRDLCKIMWRQMTGRKYLR